MFFCHASTSAPSFLTVSLCRLGTKIDVKGVNWETGRRRNSHICVFDFEIFIARLSDRFDVVQTSTGPEGIDAVGFGIFVPGAAVVGPDSVFHVDLDVLIEHVCDILFGLKGADHLVLLSDELVGSRFWYWERGRRVTWTLCRNPMT
jgi:hypothetical protein